MAMTLQSIPSGNDISVHGKNGEIGKSVSMGVNVYDAGVRVLEGVKVDKKPQLQVAMRMTEGGGEVRVWSKEGKEGGQAVMTTTEHGGHVQVWDNQGKAGAKMSVNAYGIETQSNGVFDKIQCRALEVVDKDGKKAIVLQSNEDDNQLVVYKPQNKRTNVVGIKMEANNFTNEIKIVDTTHERRSAIWLYSTVMYGTVNKVMVSHPARGTRLVELAATPQAGRLSIGGSSIFLQNSDTQNLILLEDLTNPLQSAFEISSDDGGNYSTRWIRGKDKRTNW